MIDMKEVLRRSARRQVCNRKPVARLCVDQAGAGDGIRRCFRDAWPSLLSRRLPTLRLAPASLLLALEVTGPARLIRLAVELGLVDGERRAAPYRVPRLAVLVRELPPTVVRGKNPVRPLAATNAKCIRVRAWSRCIYGNDFSSRHDDIARVKHDARRGSRVRRQGQMIAVRDPLGSETLEDLAPWERIRRGRIIRACQEFARHVERGARNIVLEESPLGSLRAGHEPHTHAPHDAHECAVGGSEVGRGRLTPCDVEDRIAACRLDHTDQRRRVARLDGSRGNLIAAIRAPRTGGRRS